MTTATITPLRTPDLDELLSIWPCRNIFPCLHDKRHYMETELYQHLGLDWRNPTHKAHVEKIVDPYCPEPIWRVRETND